MRVYLDVCCLNRPFDDQRQARIRLESEAVELVLDKVAAGALELCNSDALEYENWLNPDRERRRAIRTLLSSATVYIELVPGVVERAGLLERRGFGSMDAVHVASAELAECEAMLTCDDPLLAKSRQSRRLLRTRVLNPTEIAGSVGP